MFGASKIKIPKYVDVQSFFFVICYDIKVAVCLDKV